MDESKSGWIYGFIGVAIFSGSLPATRVAVADFDPVFLTLIRAAIAGVLALALLVLLRQERPGRSDLAPLFIVALGVVVGFPLLTALALEHITSAHSIVFIGLLPLATAIFAVLRAGDRPRPAFWVFAVAGSTLVAGFALTQDLSASWTGDILMFAAIIACGLGYAEGAKLSRKLGGWQVISWALVLSLPIMAPLAIYTLPASFAGVSQPSWIALAYVSLFSMLIGFVFWYRGLAQGGIAAVGQLQLLQPFMGLMLAATLLQEEVSWPMAAVSVAVVVCVAGAKNFAKSPELSKSKLASQPALR
ncbi:DMT family transporter [Pelagibius sp. Alg239-R121]|uniref:DMT family transporter n=1 Tax=Pelagibius sp. Alg239-R121 TaxID=2993448 RepID=UPI0024A63D18|nr:DMT family transporter [Pelagibius sp. Alg239-R121]